MSVFVFRLGRLLRVRVIEEALARERWLSCEHLARAAEAQAEQRRLELAQAQSELRAQQSAQAIDAARVMAGGRLVEGARAARRTALERARTLRFQAEEQRRAWNAKVAEVKGLERLEQRDRELARSAENASETRRLDEIASMRSAARTRENARARGVLATRPELPQLATASARPATPAERAARVLGSNHDQIRSRT